ncbi:glycosyltransferase family 2 protein [Polaromonas sp.]|nr:glycosyltransferase family 2 protein [Candidatus Saccharibacteria bacterium]
MKISIVIPVYNEGEHLAACLSAIADQTVTPYEVIVVDNNSTDHTITVANRYSFVTVLRQRRQGVVHARNKGFDAATGDVIGRIDADTVVNADWVASLQQLFADESLDAVSGAVTYHDLPWRRFAGWLDRSCRIWVANGMGRRSYLYGANMGLRRTSWQKVRSLVCAQSGLHEDFDLAIHLAHQGGNTDFASHLQATVSSRRADNKILDFWHYVWLSPSTYRAHGLNYHRRMYPVIALVMVNYFLIRLLYRCYDSENRNLSVYNMFNDRSALRVNPATFVD